MMNETRNLWNLNISIALMMLQTWMHMLHFCKFYNWYIFVSFCKFYNWIKGIFTFYQWSQKLSVIEGNSWKKLVRKNLILVKIVKINKKWKKNIYLKKVEFPVLIMPLKPLGLLGSISTAQYRIDNAFFHTRIKDWE